MGQRAKPGERGFDMGGARRLPPGLVLSRVNRLDSIAPNPIGRTGQARNHVPQGRHQAVEIVRQRGELPLKLRAQDHGQIAIGHPIERRAQGFDRAPAFGLSGGESGLRRAQQPLDPLTPLSRLVAGASALDQAILEDGQGSRQTAGLGAIRQVRGIEIGIIDSQPFHGLRQVGGARRQAGADPGGHNHRKAQQSQHKGRFGAENQDQPLLAGLDQPDHFAARRPPSAIDLTLQSDPRAGHRVRITAHADRLALGDKITDRKIEARQMRTQHAVGDAAGVIFHGGFDRGLGLVAGDLQMIEGDRQPLRLVQIPNLSGFGQLGGGVDQRRQAGADGLHQMVAGKVGIERQAGSVGDVGDQDRTGLEARVDGLGSHEGSRRLGRAELQIIGWF